MPSVLCPTSAAKVIILRWFDGLAYKEIATRLSISTGTVKVHLGKGCAAASSIFRSENSCSSNRSIGKDIRCA
ncbi:MAG: RNA polymerase sigma factor [Opitutaceae bacterium]